MKNLIKKITESRMAKLALAGSGLVYLTGCANVDPNMAMGTTVGGILLGGIPGASPAQAVIGQAAAAGGALSYQRSSYENAARQVGQGGEKLPYKIGQQVTTNLIYAGPAEETQSQIQSQTKNFALFTAGNWVDINRDGLCDITELFEKGKKSFDLSEDAMSIILSNVPQGDYRLESWTLRGELIGETTTLINRDGGYMWYIRPDGSGEGDFLEKLRNCSSGQYKITATFENGEIRAVDIMLEKNKKN